jgi:hypothetical protein
MGVLEIGIGAVFVWGRRLLLLLPLFVGHMAGTLSVLIMAPQLAYQHSNPLLLTFTGEFVVKNLVLLSAGVLVALSPEPLRPPQWSTSMPSVFDPDALDPIGLDRTVIKPNAPASPTPEPAASRSAASNSAATPTAPRTAAHTSAVVHPTALEPAVLQPTER